MLKWRQIAGSSWRPATGTTPVAQSYLPVFSYTSRYFCLISLSANLTNQSRFALWVLDLNVSAASESWLIVVLDFANHFQFRRRLLHFSKQSTLLNITSGTIFEKHLGNIIGSVMILLYEILVDSIKPDLTSFFLLNQMLQPFRDMIPQPSYSYNIGGVVACTSQL